MKTTDWFPMDTPPLKERPGVYELQLANGTKLPFPFHYWWGDGWGVADNTAEGCAEGALMDPGYRYPAETYFGGAEWRGVTQDEYERASRKLSRWRLFPDALGFEVGK